MKEYSVEKKKAVESIGLHIEKRTQIAPLAARIQALMILSSDKGMSFDEIVDFTQASKSSISSNLNLLLQMKSMEYYTIPGDRKRYFRSSKDYLFLRLEKYLEMVNEEIQVTKQINEFNKKHHEVSEEDSFGFLFKEFLEQQKNIIQNTLEKMERNLRTNN
ncbi:MAG TPA: hypothetical protein VK050_00935 [Flavobacteriaceae bacterium]|nr:hypothetical protein [Flavobacteriaceae bacterium]